MNKLPKIPPGFDNVVRLENILQKKDSNYWTIRGNKRALELFKLMSVRVPAYKDFLKKNKVNSKLIGSVKDFKNIPPIDKNNYLRAYPLEKMCWDGNLKNRRWTVATNSGSTGEPFYFPRELAQDNQYAILAELYLRDNFDIRNKSTLYLDCFAMGAWIGGLFTYEAIRIVAERGKYPLSVYTPGIFKDEIFKAIKVLGGKFDQIIIGGYPPFVKDIIDDGEKEKINWRKYNIGFVFSAEAFTEEFREYIFKKCGTKDYYKSSLNHYGTADMGTMSYETPLSILIRKIVNNKPQLSSELFKEINRLPTLTQYFPDLYFFEEENDVLYCSGYSGIPFFRYNLKDYGRIITFDDMNKRLKLNGINILKEADKNNLKIWQLPYVYLFERKDFVVKLYGANIFPDTIRHAIQQKKYEKHLTSKFVLSVKFDEKQNQYLEINLELKEKAKDTKTLTKDIQFEIVKFLLIENSEYTSNYKSMPGRQTPKVILRPYAYTDYFKVCGKHKWINK